MDPTTDSSPLKRFCTFWLGLATFVAFGLLAMLSYMASGGDSDPAYDARAAERIDIRDRALQAQADKLASAPVDPTSAAAALYDKKTAATTKPAPGTKAFEEWMAAQAAAAAAGGEGDGGTGDGGEGDGEPEPTQEVVKLKIEALPGGVMKFKQVELSVKAGAAVELTLVNPDVLQHNFLLLNPGTLEKVGALADAMLIDPEAMKKQYIPDSDDILASTKLVNPAASETIEFTAPSKPGDYPYICTFPGHWRLMNGVLKVTP